ncbi:MAG: SMP-30/gluconolactonase/LRE family protein [Novosphingobium sp.]
MPQHPTAPDALGTGNLTTTPQPVWQVGALLGEGPVWLPRERALRFVDIKGGRLHRYDPATGGGQTLEVGGNPSFLLPTQDGELLVGWRNELRLLDDDRLGEPLIRLDMPDHNRTNDATVDPDGRIWFGTMDDNEAEPTGRVYCLDRGTLHQTAVSAVVTNGPAISTDGSLLYHVDSGERTIWRFPLTDSPKLEGGEIFIRLQPDEGYTDGVVVDSEDCLWVALWDGWGVRRYAPDGTLLLHIPFPCARVTKVAFGGDDLRTAFVTTARTGLSEEQLAEQPLAGSLFALTAPAPGLPLPEARLRP